MTLATDLLWRARNVCPSLKTWNDSDRAALDRNGVTRFVDVVPAPDCPGYVAELTGGKVIGAAKLVATARDTVLGDLQFLYGSPDPAHHWVLTQTRLRTPMRLHGSAAIIGASNAENYYHWLFDSLPRLHLLTLAGIALDRIDHLLLDQTRQPFQTQSLARLGIGEPQLRQCAKRQVLRCDHLIVPSMPGPLGCPPRWVCDFLRASFWPADTAAPRRKIYLSRQNARGRRILNEAAILPLLSASGYEIVHAEQLSFIDQVNLFSQASTVISMHGAGMSNIVFTRPDTQVLELGSPLHNNLSFKTLAGNCDLEYRHLYLDSAPGAENEDTRFANVVVDPAKFERELASFST